MAGYFQMCENLEDFEICENDFNSCSQEIKERIVKFFDSPIGESKMSNMKLDGFKKNSENAMNAISTKKEQMKKGERSEKKQKLDLVKNNINIQVSSDKDSGDMINFSSEGIVMSENESKKFSEDETITTVVENTFTNLKNQNSQINNNTSSVARLLQDSTTQNSDTTSTTSTTSSGSSEYYYTSEGSLNLIEIASKAGLSYEASAEILANAPNLSEEEAQQYINDFLNNNEEYKPKTVYVISSLIVSLFMMIFHN